jgi:hypothetical protein
MTDKYVNMQAFDAEAANVLCSRDGNVTQHPAQPLSLVTNKTSLNNNRTNDWNLCHFNSVILERLTQCRISTNECVTFNRRHNGIHYRFVIQFYTTYQALRFGSTVYL